jgi:hypothetical protein
MSAVGPADINVDRSTLIGQRSMGSVGPTGQPHPEADGWGPWSGWVKEKEKGLGSGFLAESGWAGLRPNSAWLDLKG